MENLKKAVAKLASENPALRKHLVPLLRIRTQMQSKKAATPWSAYWHNAALLFCNDIAKNLKDLINREVGSRAKIITDNRSISFEAEIIPGETTVIYVSIFPDMSGKNRFVMRCQANFIGQSRNPVTDVYANFGNADAPADIAKVFVAKLHKWMQTL